MCNELDRIRITCNISLRRQKKISTYAIKIFTKLINDDPYLFPSRTGERAEIHSRGLEYSNTKWNLKALNFVDFSYFFSSFFFGPIIEECTKNPNSLQKEKEISEVATTKKTR